MARFNNNRGVGIIGGGACRNLLLNTGSVECIFLDFFLRLFRNHVYYHCIFPKISKNKSGGLENFSKINKRGGRLFGTREYPSW